MFVALLKAGFNDLKSKGWEQLHYPLRPLSNHIWMHQQGAAEQKEGLRPSTFIPDRQRAHLKVQTNMKQFQLRSS